MIPGFDWIWDGERRGEDAAGRVAGHQPRQQEVEGERHPDGERVEDDVCGETSAWFRSE